MLVKLLKSKIHRAMVTAAKVDYPGSIEIDAELMQACNLMPYESVLVADLNNGNRLETYVVPAEKGSENVIVLGAAARLINPGDRILFCGRNTAAREMQWTIGNTDVLSYVCTGEEHPSSMLGRLLKNKTSAENA